MKHCFFVIVFLCTIISGIVLLSAPFEPLFQIISVEGECQVQPPGTQNFQPAEPGKAYAYGTAIKTGRKSTALIRFSEGNECRVLANANLVITEDVKDPKLKIIKLKEGDVDVSLDEKFHESNGLNVETATAICGAIGCKFTVKSSSEGELKAVIIICKEGKIKVYGNDFNVPLMENDDGISVVGSADLTFIKLRNILGEYNLHVRDASGNEKIIELKKDWEIKIWRKLSQDNKTIVITILITGPDGSLIEAITRTAEKEGQEQEQLTPGKEGKTTATTQSSGGTDELITETPTTTTTTTTTTINKQDREAVEQLIDQLSGNTTTTQPPPVSRDDEGEDADNPTPSGHP